MGNNKYLGRIKPDPIWPELQRMFPLCWGVSVTERRLHCFLCCVYGRGGEKKKGGGHPYVALLCKKWLLLLGQFQFSISAFMRCYPAEQRERERRKGLEGKRNSKQSIPQQPLISLTTARSLVCWGGNLCLSACPSPMNTRSTTGLHKGYTWIHCRDQDTHVLLSVTS